MSNLRDQQRRHGDLIYGSPNHYSNAMQCTHTLPVVDPGFERGGGDSPPHEG